MLKHALSVTRLEIPVATKGITDTAYPFSVAGAGDPDALVPD